MSRTAVREHLRKRGIRVRLAEPMTEAQKKLVKQLYEAGEPSTAVGKKLGFSHHTILKAAHRLMFDPKDTFSRKDRHLESFSYIGIIVGSMQSKDVGVCIYCGAIDGLSREHIIPKAFGGTSTLLRASCPDCSRKTSAMETSLLKAPNNTDDEPGMLYDLRVLAKMPSRRGSTKNAKLRQLKEDTSTGLRSIEMIEPDDYVGIVMLPIFPEPDAISGASHPRGLEIEGIEWMTYVSNQQKAKKGFKYGSGFKSRKGDFPRLLAKIAYGSAVFELGYDRVKNSPLKSLILENSPDQSRWIGCDPNNTMTGQNKAVWAVEIGSYKGRLAAKIKFMPEFPEETPEYIVIIDPGAIYYKPSATASNT